MDPYGRKNTVEFIFEKLQARPSVMEIREWLAKDLELNFEQLDTMQINTMKSVVFCKFTTTGYADQFLMRVGNETTYKSKTGEIIHVRIQIPNSALKKVRVFNLQPEMPNFIIREFFENFGKVTAVTDEFWNDYFTNLKIKNGVRSVMIELKKQIPSFVDIKGHRAQVIYEGQVKTCSLCDSPEHMRSDCPKAQPAALRIHEKRHREGLNPWLPVQIQGPPNELIMTTMNKSTEILPVPTETIKNTEIDPEMKGEMVQTRDDYEIESDNSFGGVIPETENSSQDIILATQTQDFKQLHRDGELIIEDSEQIVRPTEGTTEPAPKKCKKKAKKNRSRSRSRSSLENKSSDSSLE